MDEADRQTIEKIWEKDYDEYYGTLFADTTVVKANPLNALDHPEGAIDENEINAALSRENPTSQNERKERP